MDNLLRAIYFLKIVLFSPSLRIVFLRHFMFTIISVLFCTGMGQAADFTQTKLTASDAATQDKFGYSTAISGTTAIIGSPWRKKKQGAAYLFDTTTGKLTGVLTANDAVADQVFGWSVDIAGSTAIIGASGDAGSDNHNFAAAYLFDLSTGKQTKKLAMSPPVSNSGFGESVAISDVTAIVGTLHGVAYLFDMATGKQTFKLVNEDPMDWDLFGSPVAISGTVAVVGAPGNMVTTKNNFGAVYLFDTTTGKQTAKLTASDATEADNFGGAIAIFGSTIIVGAPAQDNNRGAVYLFDLTTGKQTAKLTASDSKAWDSFGTSVDIWGTRAIVGAFGANSYKGAAYLFDLTTGKQITKLTASDSEKMGVFGISTALSATTAIIGADQDRTSGTKSGGSAYLVDLE